jgi:hypothetical protein
VRKRQINDNEETYPYQLLEGKINPIVENVKSARIVAELWYLNCVRMSVMKIPQKVSFSPFQAARGFITKSSGYRNAIKD